MLSADVEFELQAQCEYGEWQTVATVEPSTEWTELRVSLAPYRGRFVRLGFTGRFNKWYNALYMDDIAVRESTSGIEGIVVSEGEAEVYNLQGLRVSDITAPGVYIVRKGAEVRKVIIR